MKKFIDTWPTGTGIPRWDGNRQKLNEIISKYNKWTLEALELKMQIDAFKQNISPSGEYSGVLEEMLENLEDD